MLKITQVVTFKWMNCTVCELHLSRAMRSNTPQQLHAVSVEGGAQMLPARKEGALSGNECAGVWPL